MRGDERRGRRVAAVADGDSTTGVHVLMERVCRLVVDEMTLSGCALVLMSGTESA